MIFTICFISALIFLAYIIQVDHCNHSYRIIESQKTKDQDGYFLYNLHTLQCTKCGELKEKKIK